MSTRVPPDQSVQSGGSTQTARTVGHTRRRGKESCCRASVFQREVHNRRIIHQWNSEQGGSAGAATRFEQYRSRQPLTSLNTAQKHHDEFRTSLLDWTSRTLATTQHRALMQDERSFESSRKRKAQVPQIGSLPSNCPNGVFRIMYCQLNGLAVASRRADKIHDIMELAKTYEVDGAALCEVGINWSCQARNHRLSNWFNDV